MDRAYGDQSCKTYNDFRELLERKDIDAVMLAPGERWTPYIGAEAARRGIHMYYEKPLALTVEEAKAIRQIVRRQASSSSSARQQRSSTYFRTACELVRNGRIGQLQKVVIGCSGPTQSEARPEAPADPPPGFDWDMWLGPAPWAPYSDAARLGALAGDLRLWLGCIGGVWGVHDIDIAAVGQQLGSHHAGIRRRVPGPSTRTISATPSAPGISIYLCQRREDPSPQPRRRDEALPAAVGRHGSLNGVVLIGSEGHIWVSREGIQTHPDSLLRVRHRPQRTTGHLQ